MPLRAGWAWQASRCAFQHYKAGAGRAVQLVKAGHVLTIFEQASLCLPCVQVIQAAGAKAVATAGSSTKRGLLRQLGVGTAISSRDTMFVDEAALQVRSPAQ